MADVNGALTEEYLFYSATRFAGRNGAFILGGSDPIQLIRYYALRGWDPVAGDWEAWTSRSAEGADNPSGQALQHITKTPFDRRTRAGGDD